MNILHISAIAIKLMTLSGSWIATMTPRNAKKECFYISLVILREGRIDTTGISSDSETDPGSSVLSLM